MNMRPRGYLFECNFFHKAASRNGKAEVPGKIWRRGQLVKQGFAKP